MRSNQDSTFAIVHRLIGFSFRHLVRQGWRRKMLCLVLVLGLLVLPMPGMILRDLSQLSSSCVAFASSEVIKIPSRVKTWLMDSKSGGRRQSIEDRTLNVALIRLSPAKFVGYQGDRLLFNGLPTDFSGETVQGVRFSWESSDVGKLRVDATGQATLLAPGLVRIICRAGTAQAGAWVLVRPGARRVQTDDEWDADQNSLNEDGTITSGSGASGPSASWADSLIASLAPPVLAQTECGNDSSDFGYDELYSEPRNVVGSPRNRAAEPTRLGSVLPEGSNFHLAVPLYSLRGRRVRTDLVLHYNSRVWSRHGSAVTFNPTQGWPFAGFSLGFGRVFTYGSGSSTKYVWLAADGTRHYLGMGSDTTTGTYQTNDGTHITFVGSKASGGALYYNDGTKLTISVVNNRLLPTRIRDANGNYVEVSYKAYIPGGPGEFRWRQAIDYITDSLGRQLQFYYNSCHNLTRITVPKLDGGTRDLVKFGYEDRSISSSFSGLTVENRTSGTVKVPRQIFFPATETGYVLSYSTYAMVYRVSLRRDMKETGGSITDGLESAQVTYNYPTTDSSLTDAPSFSQRTENVPGGPSGTYSYATTTDAVAQIMTFTVTQPDASQLLLVRSTNAAAVANGLLVQSEIKSSAGASMAKTVYTYANDPGGSPQVQSATAYDDLNTPDRVDHDYDSHGNVTNLREYGHQSGGQWQVRRRTRHVYKTDTAYLDAYLRNLVIERNVYDALLNTNDADDVMVAKTTYTLDDYGAMGGMENYGGVSSPPGHEPAFDPSYTTRGNVTGANEFTDIQAGQAITRLRKIDRFGNVVKEQLSCCNERTYVCTQTTHWSQPEQVTNGSSSGSPLTTAMQYDFNTGAVKTRTDPNNLQTTFGYDAALRRNNTTLPTGASQTVTYNDAQQQVSTTLNYTEGTSRSVTTTETHDGWNRPTQIVSGGGQINLAYNNMGELQSRTNPFTPGGAPGPATTYTYDALGRVTAITLPDGNTVQTNYSGDVVTVTDQVSRKIKRETDGLGRLVKVTEQDSLGGLTQETTYTYDYLDNLTQVNQGNQTRSYKYDALRRLLYEKMPEQTATINDGTGVFWTKKYTYTAFSAVATRQDARGVVTTYGYDAHNRLTTITYALAPGVAATNNVTYAYDNSTTSTTKGLLLSITMSGSLPTYTETFSYDSHNRVQSRTWSRDGLSYPISYQYNTANQRTQLTYPVSARVLTYGHDSNGKLNSLADQYRTYQNGLTYNPAGHVTAQNYGNGVSESFGYNDRQQMSTQTASVGGQSRLNLTYDYQAQAGQMGPSTITARSTARRRAPLTPMICRGGWSRPIRLRTA